MLGTGSIAEFRAQVYARLQGVKVVGVLGRDAGRTRAFAQKHDIMSAATSFEALLDMGCHLIGAFNLLGKRRAEAVFAHTPTRHHDTDCEDAALAIIRYEGGVGRTGGG